MFRESISLYHHVLCEPQSLTLCGPEYSLYSQKQLIDSLQLKHSNVTEFQVSKHSSRFITTFIHINKGVYYILIQIITLF